ncbi:MAG: cupin domain-containing protein [Bacteroidota bacterium]
MNVFRLITLACLFLCSGFLFGQEPTQEPFLLDKSVLSGVGLKKIPLKNEPEKDFHQKRLFRGEDISIYVVSTETWNNKMDNFAFDEFIYMFHGEAIVKPKEGKTQLFQSQDYFFAPKGFTGEWEIKAGEHLHYELSVITTKRADSSLKSQDLSHQLFDRSTLSGAHIKLDTDGKYHEVLRKGVELTISLQAEKPGNRTLKDSKEMLVQLLSGQVSMKMVDGSSKTFYSGDFFVLPNGVDVEWISEGHGLVKYLTVEKTMS